MEERRRQSSARPSPTASTATPSTRRCTTAAASSATTPSGSRRSSRAARPPPARAQDYDKAKQLLADAGYADGIEIELTVAKYLENPQLAQLIQEQCKPAGITVKINQISYDAFYAGASRLLRHHAVAQRADDHRRVGQPADAGRLRRRPCSCPTPPWSSSHWDNPDFVSTFDQYKSTADEATRTELATKLSQIQQDDTPIMVPFFITQLRTQKKNVYGIQGPGYVLLRLQRGLHRPREADGPTTTTG